MKLKFVIIFIDLAIFSLFAGAVIYKVYEKESEQEVVIVESDVKVSQNVSNPFYGQDTSNITTTATNISNVANLNNWVWPTQTPYVITSYYQYRSDGFHDAIDIYSYSGYGSDVYSANNGTVVEASLGCTSGYTSCNGGRGNYIVISHNVNNYYTIYMHLSGVLVYEGQSVQAGDIIGKVGNTGNVWPVPNSYNPYGGTHLHFGVFIGNPLSGGSSVNPLSLY